MKTALAVVVLVVYLIALGCYAQDTSRFQSVGGDFGKKMISTIKAVETKPVAASDIIAACGAGEIRPREPWLLMVTLSAILNIQ